MTAHVHKPMFTLMFIRSLYKCQQCCWCHMLHPLSSGSPGTESTQIYNPILQLTQACDFNIMGDWDGDSFLSLSLSPWWLHCSEPSGCPCAAQRRAAPWWRAPPVVLTRHSLLHSDRRRSTRKRIHLLGFIYTWRVNCWQIVSKFWEVRKEMLQIVKSNLGHSEHYNYRVMKDKHYSIHQQSTKTVIICVWPNFVIKWHRKHKWCKKQIKFNNTFQIKSK